VPEPCHPLQEMISFLLPIFLISRSGGIQSARSFVSGAWTATVTVPEPGTLALFDLGLLGFGVTRHRAELRVTLNAAGSPAARRLFCL